VRCGDRPGDQPAAGNHPARSETTTIRSVLLAGRSALIGLLLLVVAGCSGPPGVKTEVADVDRSGERAPADVKGADAVIEAAPAAAVAGCDRKTIGEESGPLAVAYAVDDGRIASEPCIGTASRVVEDAWRDLAAIAPLQLIDDVAIVAGFEDSGSDTLAYASPVSDDSDEHLIVIGLGAATDDPQELRLTMAHELAHVFTQTTDQIDVAVFEDECDTFFNGFGCFQLDAYITAWVDQFWTPAAIDSLPADHGVDLEGGEERCAVDAGFPGSYAASHPEEDFAESFSAFVFDIDLPVGPDARLSFFEAYPEFVGMRASVRAEGAVPPANSFDRCG